jgi:hypothetical protein
MLIPFEQDAITAPLLQYLEVFFFDQGAVVEIPAAHLSCDLPIDRTGGEEDRPARLYVFLSYEHLRASPAHADTLASNIYQRLSLVLNLPHAMLPRTLLTTVL